MMKQLSECVDRLHEHKIRVFAGDVDSSELLSACCNVKLDLVKGEYIQKAPLELAAESLSQEMAL